MPVLQHLPPLVTMLHAKTEELDLAIVVLMVTDLGMVVEAETEVVEFRPTMERP